MDRVRIERKVTKRRLRPGVLPLDPRDPDIVRAKASTVKPANTERHERDAA